MRRRCAALVAAAALACAAPAGASDGAAPAGADAWVSRIADSLRIAHTMSAHAHVDVDNPGRNQDFAFDMHMLRDREGGTLRTVIELREKGDTRSIVNELIEKPGEPLTSWYWDLQKRRWVSVRGVLATDAFADTLFRYEDLWLVEPTPRRKGRSAWVEHGGRRFVEIESEPYHYYQRVVTRIDPESGLPTSVRFIDTTGTPIREQRYEQVTLVDGLPFPTVVRLRDLVAGGETTVTYGDVRFGRRIPPSFFDLSVIDDRIRRGVDPVPDPPDLPDLADRPRVAPPAAAP
ncbi:MAG: hypothetical protein DCC71_14515 [Proteobacteria bacterium]|nr:MAG: hypothetical protein DCC71_14515 [Pseudomonadota bacterium]